MIYDLQSSVGYQLTVASRTNERNIEAVLEEFGLSRVAWVTLVAVGSHSLSQPSRIAEFLGVDRPTVSRALTALEKHDLVERVHAGSDARRVVVQITRNGDHVLSKAVPMVRACNDALTKPLSDYERATLYRLLAQINASRPSLSRI